MVENSTNTQVWIEKYNSQSIYISNSSNNTGSIVTDINGNYIGNPLQDNVYIEACTKFSGVIGDYVLIYDDSQWCLIKGTYDLSSSTSNIIGRYVFRQNVIPKYKVRAYMTSFNFDGNSANLGSGITTKSIFKVILNSKETTDYTFNGNIIVFSDYKLFGNTMTIIYYDTDQTLGIAEIILKYYTPLKSQPLLTEINTGII